MNKNKFLILLKEKTEWRNNKTLINIVYYLQAHNLIKIDNIDDFNDVYDNLEINNEIIDKDNFEDYDMNYIKKTFNIHFTVSKIEERIKNGQMLLLNFYTNLLFGVKQDRTHLVDCKIWLDLNANPLGL